MLCVYLIIAKIFNKDLNCIGVNSLTINALDGSGDQDILSKIIICTHLVLRKPIETLRGAVRSG